MILTRPFKTTLATALAALLLVAGPGAAQQFESNILTGGPTGTYIQFGKDIKSAAAECGVELNVRESAGSLENFLGVRQRRFTQFGIVQSDVLEYLRTFAADDSAVARAIHGVRIAFPLYNEEVHILARREIGSLGDLAGRKVAIGVEDSGTFLTASLVMDLAEVDPAESLTISAQDSLDALIAGEIDAFFYVAGVPARIFEDPRIDGEQFHLVSIDDPTLQAVYLPAEIPADAYPFQSDPAQVVAVKAVLMTYEFNPNRNAYHNSSCSAVSNISHIIATRFDQVTANGHPKWQQVDLADIPPGWDVGSCVNVGVSPDYPLACGDEPAMSPESSPESAANQVYRQRICATVGC